MESGDLSLAICHDQTPQISSGSSCEAGRDHQNAIQRRTLDTWGPLTKWLQLRGSSWESCRFQAMMPIAATVSQISPVARTLSQAGTCITNTFTSACTNKIRCSIDSLAWTPDGRRCLTGSRRGEFTLWNSTSFRFEGILQAHEAAITCMRYSHNENWLVTSDGIGHIKYWKGRNELVKEFEAHKECVKCISFSPSSMKFATASTDSTLKIWNFVTCQEDRALNGHARDALSCDWHPLSSIIVSGSKDFTVKLWDARVGGHSLSSLEGHMNEVTSVQWHSSGQLILSAARDSQVKMWDTRTLKEVAAFSGAEAPVNCAIWHPVNSDMFVSGNHDGAIMFWSASRKAPQAAVEAHQGPVCSLAWHPEGHLLASGGGDSLAKFWCRGRPGDAWEDKGKHHSVELQMPGHVGIHEKLVRRSSGIPGIAE